jgi:hypothetical protein
MAENDEGTHTGNSDGGLDLQSFVPFAPLLEACQDFAALTGYRFRNGDLQAFEALCPKDDQMLPAMEKAKPVVVEFQQRLAQREQELLDVLLHAHRLLMNESVRNAIVSTCRELDLWPPKPSPSSILDDDCAFEDTAAPLPSIAQRAYNDEMRRNSENVLQPLCRRAETASFLVDFATEVGVELPLGKLHQDMLQEFMSRVEEWVQSLGGQHADSGQVPLGERARKAILKGLGPGSAPDALKKQVKDRWSKNWESTGGTLLNLAIVGLAMAAGAATVSRAVSRK